jgi:hypothetical protein
MSQLASNRVRSFAKRVPHSGSKSIANRLLSTISQRDLLVVLCFCAIGLVVTFAALAELSAFPVVMEEIGSLY